MKKTSSIKKIINDAKKGKMFILVDNKDRENEGDVVIPASKINPKTRSCETSTFLLLYLCILFFIPKSINNLSKINQNGSKIHQNRAKMAPKTDPSAKVDFGCSKWCQNRSKMEPLG